MRAPVNETLALGLIAVAMLVWLEKHHESELVSTHQDGFAAGYKLGQSDIAETMAKKVTDKTCHLWWFQGDTKKVSNSIQKAKVYE
jgi:hypothetical protein